MYIYVYIICIYNIYIKCLKNVPLQPVSSKKNLHGVDNFESM